MYRLVPSSASASGSLVVAAVVVEVVEVEEVVEADLTADWDSTRSSLGPDRVIQSPPISTSTSLLIVSPFTALTRYEPGASTRQYSPASVVRMSLLRPTSLMLL